MSDVGAAMRGFDESLPMALMQAREAVMRRFRPILAEHALTEQQWRVLRALADAPEPVTAGDLAERTFLLGPSLSRILANLTERGLVARTTDAADARRAVLTISAAGRRLVGTVAPRSEIVYDGITAELGSESLDTLYALLRRTAALEGTR